MDKLVPQVLLEVSLRRVVAALAMDSLMVDRIDDIGDVKNYELCITYFGCAMFDHKYSVLRGGDTGSASSDEFSTGEK
jgi:hypothetical protein